MNTHNSLSRSAAKLSLGILSLLTIPLIAMQFTQEVNWTLSDFIFAGVLLFGTGFTYLFITQKSMNLVYKAAIAFALLSGLFLIWVNLAVGIIGSENNPFNLLYFGVIAVGMIGALIAKFESQKLVYTMFSMAFATALVGLIALFTSMHQVPGSSVIEVLAVNGLFITIFTMSALLFRFAASEQTGDIENGKTVG